MRLYHSKLIILLSILTMLSIVPAVAQDDVSVTLFVDSDSLTVYLPEQGTISLADFGFAIVSGEQSQTFTLLDYNAFGIPFDSIPTPACFRLLRNGATVPLSTQCDETRVLTQVLSNSDVFWYNTVAGNSLTLTILQNDESIDFCAAGQSSCELIYPTISEDERILDERLFVMGEDEVNRIAAATVQLTAPDGDFPFVQSGIIVSPDGLIITAVDNFLGIDGIDEVYLCESGESIIVVSLFTTLNNLPEDRFRACIVYWDNSYVYEPLRLIVLTITEALDGQPLTDFTPLPYITVHANFSPPQTGDIISVSGYPYFSGQFFAVTTGNIISTRPDFSDSESTIYVGDIFTDDGSFGGGVFDRDGNLMGIFAELRGGSINISSLEFFCQDVSGICLQIVNP